MNINFEVRNTLYPFPQVKLPTEKAVPASASSKKPQEVWWWLTFKYLPLEHHASWSQLEQTTVYLAWQASCSNQHCCVTLCKDVSVEGMFHTVFDCVSDVSDMTCLGSESMFWLHIFQRHMQTFLDMFYTAAWQIFDVEAWSMIFLQIDRSNTWAIKYLWTWHFIISWPGDCDTHKNRCLNKRRHAPGRWGTSAVISWRGAYRAAWCSKTQRNE